MRFVTREDMEEVYLRDKALWERQVKRTADLNAILAAKPIKALVFIGGTATTALGGIRGGFFGLIMAAGVFFTLFMAAVYTANYVMIKRTLDDRFGLMKMPESWVKELSRNRKLFAIDMINADINTIPEYEKNIKRLGKSSASIVYYEAIMAIYDENLDTENTKKTLERMKQVPVSEWMGKFSVAQMEMCLLVLEEKKGEAVRFFEENYEILAGALDSNLSMACNYLSLTAEYFFAKGDHEKALELFTIESDLINRKLAESAEIGDKRNMEFRSRRVSGINIDLARCYARLGDREKALYCLNAAAPLTKISRRAKYTADKVYGELEVGTNDRADP